MNVRRVVDGAVGETRIGLFGPDGRPVELDVRRWSEEGRRALYDTTYVGRVRAVDPSRRGAFIDIGLPDQAFLPLRAGSAPVEGAMISVRIAREAARGKSALVDVLGPVAPGAKPGAAELCAAERCGPANPGDRAALDEAVAEALAPIAPIPGGGRLIIEPTAALVAIDVDAAGRPGSRNGARFALDLNLAAAREAMRQLRLRALGGIVAIDFVSMPQRAGRDLVRAALAQAAAHDPCEIQIAPMSRFGVVELARAQRRRPVHEAFATAEAHALALLRAIEAAAAGARGRMVVARGPHEALQWLQADHIGWRAAMTDRIGARWRIAPESEPTIAVSLE